MKIKSSISVMRSRGVQGALLTALVGYLLLALPFGRSLRNWSYDLAFWFRADVPIEEAVILYMDLDSQERLQQSSWDKWDRSLHASLVEKLAAAGARLIVFDVLIRPGSTNDVADQKLIHAVRKAGNVVLAAMITPVMHNFQIITPEELTPPFPELADAAPWGLVEAGDDTKAVREHFRDFRFEVPSLAWRVAEQFGVHPLPDPLGERYLNYYGPPGHLPNRSYVEAYQSDIASLSWLSNKVVFIGARPTVGYLGGKGTDEYRTPYTTVDGKWSPGVDVVATASLNLMRGDWLERLPPLWEFLLMLILGGALGWGLARCRPMVAAAWAVLGALVVGVISIFLTWQAHVWFPWMIVAAAQAPCALGWAVLVHTQRLLREKNWLQKRLAFASGAEELIPAPTPAEAGQPTLRSARARPAPPIALTRQDAMSTISSAVSVPDHELLRRIGEGAYGEVWLARDLIGTFHAVKFVYRRTFTEGKPFEREFNGLKRFTPISRSHPGLVQILHVGRHASPECLYYIMEIADDETAGPHFDAGCYSPKSLARIIQKQKRLPLADCIQLGIDVADALEFLHRKQLIHRDVKPSNIIFVEGAPKLADIGLVTDLGHQPSDRSYVGTSGYLAPEGPGTRQGDIYALGKVLYEAGFGMNRTAFPELPATLFESDPRPELLEFNRIILEACAAEPADRFPSAAELQARLKSLWRQLSD